MALGVNGLSVKWSHHSILGFTDSETVMLDLDDMSFRSVKYWSLRTMNWFQLGGFIILKSSDRCYHVVFNRKVSWTQNMSVVAWVSLLSHNKDLHRWLEMQCIKQASTLRIGPKRQKPSPRIVYKYGEQNGQIEGVLKYRRMIKRIMKTMGEPD